MLIYENQIPYNKQAFIEKVLDVSNRLGINPNWLMAVMYFESAKTFSPGIQNPYTNATGLIQFMPSTAIELGTTIFELKNMTAVQQLEYVYKYYSRYKSKIKSYVDLYLSTFFPAAIGKPLDFIVQTNNISAELIANQNPIFDLDNNNKITVSEIQKVMLDKIPQNWLKEFTTAKNNLGVLLAFLIFGYVGLTIYKYTKNK